MASRIPYLVKGAKIIAKKELPSPSGRQKTKRHQTIPEVTPTTLHIGQLFVILQ